MARRADSEVEPGEGTPPAPRAPRARPARSGTLLVVESPAKAKTLKRLLGSGVDVRATVGHLKDLPAAILGVDVERGFEPRYDLVKGQARVLSELKRAARTAERVLIATDPDREGEAIAWHLAEELGAPGGDARIRRVLLDELTPEAVRAAVERPRDLDRHRFEAQQARRILDRLVGFQVSPILWRAVRRGLSAGRVQSVAVRLVVERERAIEAFRPSVAHAVEAELVDEEGRPLLARLAPAGGRAAAEALRRAVEGRAFTVRSVERTDVARPAPPPFTTATLQQEASRRLGFAPRRTMALAQRLYEGVELGEEGLLGLVTYLRTDSVRLAAGAVEAARRHVERVFGADHLPASPNQFSARGRGVQGAHEALRPTSMEWPPERVRPLLEAAHERDLGRLYELVWSRFVASQMAPAVYRRAAVELAAGDATFRAEGASLAFDGWLAAWGKKPPEQAAGEEPPPGGASAWPAGAPLPPLEPGQPLRLVEARLLERPARPPPRFDEASLVRELEERGLGRPSTFAAILDTVQEKGYVERHEKALRPTELGRRVTEELARRFPRELDAAFTAALEAKLDAVEEGTADWRLVLAEFHGPFREAVARAEAEAREAGRRPIEAGIACDTCGRPLAVRWGRNGEFLSCTGYPACRTTMGFRREGGVIVPERADEVQPGESCPACAAPMILRRGRFGRFLSCSRYPACDGRRDVTIGVACPLGCGGQVAEKRSRQGKTFYGCSTWPGCDFVSWDRPRAGPCPDCGGAWLVERVSKRDGPVIACPDRACGYRRAASAPPPAPA
ncbi:MAG TPA: type I DNA topoisomerase [Anaeromyxobacteraceae bacterium]|nr:type I DNA topoisomerase [Anaeromyxobacteraceae bacterium]